MTGIAAFTISFFTLGTMFSHTMLHLYVHRFFRELINREFRKVLKLLFPSSLDIWPLLLLLCALEVLAVDVGAQLRVDWCRECLRCERLPVEVAEPRVSLDAAHAILQVSEPL